MDTNSTINNNSFQNLDTNNINSDLKIIFNSLDSIWNQNNKEFLTQYQTIVESRDDGNLLKFISNDTLFSTIITIIVFSIGLLANYIKKRIDRHRNKRETRKFVKHHLDNIVDSHCLKLKSAYTDFSNDTSIDTGIPITPPKILSNNFQRILHIDNRELFFAIKDKDSLSKIISQIDFLDSLIPEVQNYHNSILIENNKLRDKLDNLVNNFLEQLANFLEYERENMIDYDKSDSYKTINNLLYKFYNELAGKRELDKFYNNILRPIQDYLIDTNIFRTHIIGKEIAKLGKDLSVLITDLRITTDEFKQQYKEFAEKINDSTNSLKENINNINWR